MPKMFRNYQARFTVTENGESEYVIINYPFTCNFDINIGYQGSTNIATFQFTNLSFEVQKKLWIDTYNGSFKEGFGKSVKVEFFAGYGKTEDLPYIFEADVMNCTSYRPSGSTDVITTVETMKGSSLYDKFGYANATFEKGTKYADVLESLIKDIPDVQLGYISDDLPTLSRKQSFMGKTITKLKNEFMGYNIFIEDGLLNVIKDNEILPGYIQLINESTGLLGTPKISNMYLEVESIFEPGLRISQLVQLECDYPLIQNNTYRIISLHHKGTISGATCGDLTTSILLANGSLKEDWKKLERYTEQKYKTLTQDVAVTGWIKPVNGVVTSAYGKRVAPKGGASTNHKGVDIGADLNSPIKCPYNGVVVNAYYNGGYGNYILINHGNNEENIAISSEYGHLNKYIVKAGQQINQGDIIGYVGSTGNSTGPHLHFGIKENGVNVNPTKYVRF